MSSGPASAQFLGRLLLHCAFFAPMELLLGCVAGFCIGATGVGGGLLAAPALILLFGVPSEISIGTAMVFLTAARLHAGLLYLLRGKVVWRATGSMLLGGVPGALIGPWLLRQVVVHVRPGTVLLPIGAIVVLSASLSLGSVFFRPGKIREYRPGILPWAGLMIGTALGFSSAGAGSLGAMTLLQFTDIEPASIIGTDIMVGLALSLTAALAYFASGTISGSLLWKLALGGLPGVFAGVLFGTRLSPRRLRTAISVWALVLGTILAAQGLRSCLP
jgi:uncharacterized membrane protein YfcA